MVDKKAKNPEITETDLQITKISLQLANFQKKILKKHFKFFTALKFNSLQRMSIITPKFALLGGNCLSSIDNQLDITIGLLSMGKKNKKHRQKSKNQ